MLVFHGCPVDYWGFIPSFLNENDPRPAKEQFASNYQGGWNPTSNGSMNFETLVWSYPGDPDLHPFGALEFRDELIVLYPYDMVAIVNTKTKTFEMSRMS